MSFSVPSSSELLSALSSQKITVSNMESARIFLQDKSRDKNPGNRIISWLIVFRIIKGDSDGLCDELASLGSAYKESISEHFSSNPDDPLSLVNQDFSNWLRKDLSRIVSWFNIIKKDVGITDDDVPDVLNRLHRIYAKIVLEVSNVSYMQGLDRYGTVCLLAAVTFTKAAGLPLDFAEALGFYLTKSALTSVPFLKTFQDQSAIKEHFDKVDEIISYVAPNKYRIMIHDGSSTRFFGSRWEMLLFADEHSGDEILYLWDQIFGRLEKIAIFVQCLTIAHMLQIDIEHDCLSVNATVLHWRDWNMRKLITESLNLMNHRKTSSQKYCTRSCPCCHSLHGYEVLADV